MRKDFVDNHLARSWDLCPLCGGYHHGNAVYFQPLGVDYRIECRRCLRYWDGTMLVGREHAPVELRFYQLGGQLECVVRTA